VVIAGTTRGGVGRRAGARSWALAGPLIRAWGCARAAVGGAFSALAPAPTAPPPASAATVATVAALATIATVVAGAVSAPCGLGSARLTTAVRLFIAGRLIAALRLLRTGPQVRARSAIRLRGAFRPPRGGITAVLAARASVAPWFPLTIAAYIAVPVPISAISISAIAISIPIAAAAAAAIAIVPGVAMRRPMTLSFRR
jgi:hypothetical protein